MRVWADDSKKCQLLNGNPAVESTTKTKSQPAMFCYDDPTPPGFEKWQYTYVGTIKLDGASERDFESDKKWKVDVLCTRTGDQKFECIQAE